MEQRFTGKVTQHIRKHDVLIVDSDIWVPVNLFSSRPACKIGERVEGKCVSHQRGVNNWLAVEARTPICRFWLRGQCKDGSFCDFRHGTPLEERSPGASSRRKREASGGPQALLAAWAAEVDRYLASSGGQSPVCTMAGGLQLPLGAHGTITYRQALESAGFVIKNNVVFSRHPGTRSPHTRDDAPLRQPKRQRATAAAAAPAYGAVDLADTAGEAEKRARRAERFGSVEPASTLEAELSYAHGATLRVPPRAARAGSASSGGAATCAVPRKEPTVPWAPRAPAMVLPPFVQEYYPLTPRHMRYIDELTSDDVSVVLALGTTGAAKTLYAVQEGLRALRDKASRFKRIVLTRPIARGESNLKAAGTDEEALMRQQRRTTLKKIDEVMGEGVWPKLRATGQLEFQPFDDIRGDSFDPQTWLIADEIQNATLEQVGRLCKRYSGGKICLTGDDSQFDGSQANMVSGLRLLADRVEAEQAGPAADAKFRNYGVVRFTPEDSCRHCTSADVVAGFEELERQHGLDRDPANHPLMGASRAFGAAVGALGLAAAAPGAEMRS